LVGTISPRTLDFQRSTAGWLISGAGSPDSLAGWPLLEAGTLDSLADWPLLETGTLGITGALEACWIQQPTPIVVIEVDDCQLSQFHFYICRERRCTRASRPKFQVVGTVPHALSDSASHGPVTHTTVSRMPWSLSTINKCITPTFGHEVANIPTSLPQHVCSAENFSLASVWNIQNARSLEPKDCSPCDPRQLREDNSVENQNDADELHHRQLRP